MLLKAKKGFTLNSMNTIVTVLALLCLIIGAESRVWSPEYITALLQTRQCYSTGHLAVMDSFFDHLNDTTLNDHYYARTMTTLSHRLDRGESICLAIVETGSHIYREITWHKRQEIRRMTDKKILPVLHSGREATIVHLQQTLSNGFIRDACEALPALSKDELELLRVCVRDRRKESMRAYTKFTE